MNPYEAHQEARRRRLQQRAERERAEAEEQLTGLRSAAAAWHTRKAQLEAKCRDVDTQLKAMRRDVAKGALLVIGCPCPILRNTTHVNRRN